MAKRLGACNERVASKSRSIMAFVCKICTAESTALITLQQAKAALGCQLEAIKVRGCLLHTSCLSLRWHASVGNV
jgi:hypothetical protein